MSVGEGDRRGYSWDPFEPGNEAATKHGAQSPRKVEPVAEQLRSELAEAAPWTLGPAFAAAVAAWSWAEAQCVLLRRWLDEVGLLDDDGEPRPAMNTLHRVETKAERARAKLGLSPADWASLHRSLTVGPDGTTDSLDALIAVGQRMLEAGEAGPGADDSDENDTDVVRGHPDAEAPATGHTAAAPAEKEYNPDDGYF